MKRMGGSLDDETAEQSLKHEHVKRGHSDDHAAGRPDWPKRSHDSDVWLSLCKRQYSKLVSIVILKDCVLRAYEDWPIPFGIAMNYLKLFIYFMHLQGRCDQEVHG